MSSVVKYRARCGAEEETSANVLCEREALVALRHSYLGFFFLDPEEVRCQSLGGQSGTSVKEQGSYGLDIRLWGTKGLSKGSKCVGTERIRIPLLFCSKHRVTTVNLTTTQAIRSSISHLHLKQRPLI